ncbi:hybrid sensor histidine kinase/response regulator [Roseateles violae]|uniref:histidine kinase n=1 Tax=Roseateles violae TaxID=3058042 RepID=A0ABT8DM62_9BURK|nr:hybrid sensor histidine kinase/response regulator [Pelomonas sp. PFR6]MDN3919480.1 hybrid sensor histidine kinase/response regulator [Pelomonas sp. PFR6]
MNARSGEQAPETRILLRTATSRDALMACAVLEHAGLQPRVCADMASLLQQFQDGAGALMLAEETLADDASAGALGQLLAAQPPWSDVPVLVLARSGADSRAITRAMAQPANITVIERPVRVAALVSAARSALRARSRQYEVRALLRDLNEADRRKTEFLATLAHELRNPLAPLSTALALLTRRQIDAADSAHYYALMQRQVEHMARLVDDLMEVSRITRGKIELRMDAVPLEAVLNDAIEQSRPYIRGAGHQLDRQLPARPLLLRGDAVRLTQIFANLLNNAAKYTAAGGRIGIAARELDGEARIEVSDTGMGIEPSMLDSVFDMFVQANGSARRAQGGLGIGLTLVKSLVELHGGRVAARSAGLGQGSTVVVHLPLLEPDQAGAAPAPLNGSAAGPAPEPGDQTVLIVDDNHDAADTLAELLGALGARPAIAYSGAQALRLVHEQMPRLAILDLGMPDMDGYELARRLRELPRGADILLVALSGWGQADDRERAAAAGFDRHLLKPAELEQLRALLDWHANALR